MVAYAPEWGKKEYIVWNRAELIACDGVFGMTDVIFQENVVIFCCLVAGIVFLQRENERKYLHYNCHFNGKNIPEKGVIILRINKKNVKVRGCTYDIY